MFNSVGEPISPGPLPGIDCLADRAREVDRRTGQDIFASTTRT